LGSEWSFVSLDSGLPCQHGAGERFDTEAQRARAFQIYQSMMFETPFCIGSDYFMWVDQPSGGMQSASNPEDCSYGLVKENDEPYPILVKAATEINRSLRLSSAASRIWRPSLGRQQFAIWPALLRSGVLGEPALPRKLPVWL